MIAPKGFDREAFASKLRAEMAAYGDQRATDARLLWLPVGFIAGILFSALFHWFINHK